MAKVEQPEIHTITAAQRALSREQVGRTRKYLISMAIRTACVIAAIFVPGWPRWALIAGAIILPYLAVVVANAGRENDEPGQTGNVAEVTRPELATPLYALSESADVIVMEPLADARPDPRADR